MLIFYMIPIKAFLCVCLGRGTGCLVEKVKLGGRYRKKRDCGVGRGVENEERKKL